MSHDPTEPADARAARRAISDQFTQPPRLTGTPHPFGVRNGLLCQARKLASEGKFDEAKKKVDEAHAIAPLTAKERYNVDRAYYLHYLSH